MIKENENFKIELKKLDEKVTKTVIAFIDNRRKSDIEIKALFSVLQKLGDVYILGGAIRDISINKIPKDIDIIIDCSENQLTSSLLQFEYIKNKFGGFKILTSSIKVDVWSIDNHWCFKEKLLKKTMMNISKSSLINLCSAVINITKNKSYYKYYNKGISTNGYMIDFNTTNKKLLLANHNLSNQIEKCHILESKLKFSFSNKVEGYYNSKDHATNSLFNECSSSINGNYQFHPSTK